MFILSFSTDNAAFENYPKQEAAQILHKIAAQLEGKGMVQDFIRDYNGNTIGSWSFNNVPTEKLIR